MPDGIRELEPALYPEAAAIATEALLNDPGWVAVGPKRTGHRRFVVLRYHGAVMKIVGRYGGPVYGAFRDGELVGIAATFAAGRYPPPARTFVRYVRAFLAAGPGPIVRGLRTSAIMERAHPKDEHVYLWILAVDPASQRGGVGRALLARVFDEAEAPVYLETANPANVPTTRAPGSRRSAARISRAARPCGS